jgi:streptogramin lyase
VSDVSYQGSVHGGQQPVSGAHVYLMQATSAGYGNASTSLITQGSGSDGNGGYVVSDANGNFLLTATYICTPNTQVYAVATGGNPGLATGTTNESLALIANLGNCPALGTLALQVPVVTINEVTTVASVYALAGFMTGTFQVSSSPSALAATGLANAFATTGNLSDIAHGTPYAQTPGGNGTAPFTKVNTLANILSACVNSNGAVTAPSGSGPTGVSGSPCYTLFQNAKSGTITPTDTAAALLNIAHNPSANVGALFGLITSNPPFQPTMSSAPNDFALTIIFTVPGMGNPTANDIHAHNVAIDAEGNVWSANDVTNSLGEASSLGVALSGTTGYTGNGMNAPGGVAVDNSSAVNVYVPNYGSNTVSVFTSQGAARTTAPVLTAGAEPADVAVDSGSNVWVVNSKGNSVSKFSSSGAAAANSPFSGNGLNAPAGVAAEAGGNVWVTDSGANAISAFTNAGGVVPGSPFSLALETTPFGVAIDGLDQIWSTDKNTGVFATNNAGTEIPFDPFYGNSAKSNAVAIDGAGQAWVTDSSKTYLNVFNPVGAVISGPTGYLTGLTAADSIAIDGSGNVWFTPVNSATVAGDTTVHEMVGAAAPVVTPIAAAVANNTLGSRP